MSQYNESGIKTFTSAAAIAKCLRVALSAAGVVDIADETEAGIGTANRPTFAAEEHIPVKLLNCQGTHMFVAAAAFAVGAEVFAAAAGKIDDSGTISLGTALQAATADGDIVEVVPGIPRAAAV